MAILICGMRRLKTPNNLLKTDCQRGAIFVQVGYSVYGGLVECSGRVVSHLAGRYVPECSGQNREYREWSKCLSRVLHPGL
ncbi:hypothetical protein VCHA52P455_30292 [Vibrio chagasii]|nr:hypothetical protein VCHA52P455_30292 [Vibrio chagasii]CAH7276361.1 hypothetical protein VCHA37P202_360006 [Vibrio chagasii]CAH7426594.1 hypothetical protein VCHA49P380_90060 [Vibrio chagasii]